MAVNEYNLVGAEKQLSIEEKFGIDKENRNQDVKTHLGVFSSMVVNNKKLMRCTERQTSIMKELAKNVQELSGLLSGNTYFFQDYTRKLIKSGSEVLSDGESAIIASSVISANDKVFQDLKYFNEKVMREQEKKMKKFAPKRANMLALIDYMKSNPDKMKQNKKTDSFNKRHEEYKKMEKDLMEQIVLINLSRNNMLYKNLHNYMDSCKTFFSYKQKMAKTYNEKFNFVAIPYEFCSLQRVLGPDNGVVLVDPDSLPKIEQNQESEEIKNETKKEDAFIEELMGVFEDLQKSRNTNLLEF